VARALNNSADYASNSLAKLALGQVAHTSDNTANGASYSSDDSADRAAYATYYSTHVWDLLIYKP